MKNSSNTSPTNRLLPNYALPHLVKYSFQGLIQGMSSRGMQFIRPHILYLCSHLQNLVHYSVLYILYGGNT